MNAFKLRRSFEISSPADISAEWTVPLNAASVKRNSYTHINRKYILKYTFYIVIN